MSKEKDKILRTLEHIAITFDKLGFSPTIPICTGHKDFEYLFRLELGTIKELCNQQDQRIAELEEQLKNAVVLKPDRYVIVNNWWKKKKYGIAKVHQQVLDSYSIQTGYMGDVSPCLEYGEFATLEEAQAKLKELKGE